MISQKTILDGEGAAAEIQGVSEDERSVIARLQNGHLISVPIQLLTVHDETQYYLQSRFRELERSGTLTRIVPVIEEIPVIETRTVETARVTVRKSVSEQIQTIEQPLRKEEVHIERVEVHRMLNEPAEVRVEGDVTIIPVQEEILVVEKKILVREEIRVRRVQKQVSEKIEVPVRKEDISIDRKKVN